MKYEALTAFLWVIIVSETSVGYLHILWTVEVCYLWILAPTVPPRITNGDRKSWGYVQKRHFQSGRKTFSCGRCKVIPQGAQFTSLWNIHLIQQWMLSTAITQSDLCPRPWYEAFSERITGALSPGRAVLLEISSGRSRLSGSCYKRSTVKQENIWWHSSSSTVSYGALHQAISKLCGQLTAAKCNNQHHARLPCVNWNTNTY